MIFFLFSFLLMHNNREASAAGDGGEFDPFKRRSCRPKILWSVGNSSTRPPTEAGGAAGDGGDGGVEEAKSESATNGVVPAEEGVPDVEEEVAPSEPTGLQKMHSFGGVDVLEAGKAALEKRLGEVKTRAAPREGGRLTLGKYLEKARVDP